MRKAVFAAVVGFVAALFVSVSSVQAAPYCGITWGSLPKEVSTMTSRSLTNIRTGQHDCYDRMVFDLTGTTGTGYKVQYVSAVRADGSGAVVPVNGGAKLQIRVNAPVYNTSGTVTYNAAFGQKLPGVNLTGYQTFKEAKYAGSFEGYTTVGLGVRAQLPFRVFVTGNHVVVDVAHYW
ncbi:MAG TPA: hypothetical protein VLA92_01110 [Candidatus Saccharimonadales bacterium]|nr:hypothetical protein [Candidatus Saccharimonadales bacterium]